MKSNEGWCSRCENTAGCATNLRLLANPGVPDRIIITPDGRTVYVELKTEVGHLANIQQWQIAEMRRRGADIRVVKGLPAVQQLVAELFGGANHAV